MVAERHLSLCTGYISIANSGGEPLSLSLVTTVGGNVVKAVKRRGGEFISVKASFLVINQSTDRNNGHSTAGAAVGCQQEPFSISQ